MWFLRRPISLTAASLYALVRRVRWGPRARAAGPVRPSFSVAAYPIVAALKAADAFLGPERQWRAVRTEQERLLAGFFASGQAEIDCIPELESLASRDATELNDFLALRGFPPFFTPFEEQRFGIASVLDLLVEWAHGGHASEIAREDGRRFPAVRIASGDVCFFRSARHRSPVARLATKSGDAVCMTMFDDPPAGLGLLEGAHELSRTGKEVHDFDGLVFPMVHLDQAVELGWLLALAADDEEGIPWLIEAALQRNRLRMNEIGARAESAVMVQPVAVGLGWEPKPDHVIDRSFLVWFERDGLSRPLFAAFVAEEEWRNPGAIA